MAIGYLAKSGSNTTGMSYDAMLYCKTNIAGYFFDGFIDIDYSSELEITSNPVETGVAVTDHSYRKPRELVMNVMMSDVHQSLVPGQFDNGWSRSQSAYKILETIQNNRIPVSVLTRLGLYENMIIRRLQAKDDYETFQALSATVSLVELPVARVKTVKISAAPQTTNSSQLGTLQAVEVTDKIKESALYLAGFGAGAQ